MTQPPIISYQGPGLLRETLREIASRQRAIILCILVYLTAALVHFVVPFPINAIASLAAVAAGITGAVFVFMLTIKIYGAGLGIVLGILTLVPIIGLIVLLFVNAKATGILKQNNIPVGFLGTTVN
jgi:hypothetical protein